MLIKSIHQHMTCKCFRNDKSNNCLCMLYILKHGDSTDQGKWIYRWFQRANINLCRLCMMKQMMLCNINMAQYISDKDSKIHLCNIHQDNSLNKYSEKKIFL